MKRNVILQFVEAAKDVIIEVLFPEEEDSDVEDSDNSNREDN